MQLNPVQCWLPGFLSTPRTDSGAGNALPYVVSINPPTQEEELSTHTALGEIKNPEPRLWMLTLGCTDSTLFPLQQQGDLFIAQQEISRSSKIRAHNSEQSTGGSFLE